MSIVVYWYWYSSVLVYWYIGISIMVYWYIGILVYWCIGILVYWCIDIFIGIVVYWYIGSVVIYWYIGYYNDGTMIFIHYYSLCSLREILSQTRIMRLDWASLVIMIYENLLQVLGSE